MTGAQGPVFMSHAPVLTCGRSGGVACLAPHLHVLVREISREAWLGLFSIRKYTYTHHPDAQVQPSAAKALNAIDPHQAGSPD